MNFPRPTRKQWASFLVIVLVFTAFFAVAGVVGAQETANVGDESTPTEKDWNPIALGLSYLIEALIGLLGRILTALIAGVIALSEYSDFVNAAAVVNGWVIVRDIANMFFIIVLLFIAFGTILGQEEYHYKKLLPKLLILAVLVNFSRTIIGVMIDFAQVIMLTFVNGYKVAAGGNFANIFQITKLMQYDPDCASSQTLGPWTVFGAAVLALAMVIISIITITVILMVLALRIVMLWLLTVLAPIAFLAGTFPQGQEYYAQWWKEFKNQVMVGPMLAFFLWLSLVSLGSGNAATQITRDGQPLVPNNPAEGEVTFACSAVGQGSDLISYVIGIMLLLTSVQISQQMGGVIAGVAGRAKQAATRTLKYGAKAFAAPFAFGATLGGRRLQRELLDRSTRIGKKGPARLVKYLIAPTQSISGLLKRGERLTEEARQRAYGASQEDADRWFTSGARGLVTFGIAGQAAVTTPHQRLTEAAERDEYAKEYAHMNRTEFMAQAQSLMGKKGKEYEKRREALWFAAVPKGYNDDMMRNWAEQYQAVGREKYGMEDGHWDDNILRGEFAYDFLSSDGIDITKAAGTGRAEMTKNWRNEQGAFATMADAEKDALKTHHPENAFHQGPMETEGKDRGYFKGSWGEFYDASDFSKKINMGLDGKELEQRLMHDKLKFRSEKDADGNMVTATTGWYDTETGALALRKYKTDKAALTLEESVEKKNRAVIPGNSRQGDESVMEARKLGRDAARFATHATTPLGNHGNLDGHGWEMTREQVQLAEVQTVSGEERQVQERVVSQRHGEGASVDPDNLVLTVDTEDAFLRMKAMGENAPGHVVYTSARGGMGQHRQIIVQNSEMTLKGPKGMQQIIKWKDLVYGESQMPKQGQLQDSVFENLDQAELDKALDHLSNMGPTITDAVADSMHEGVKGLEKALKNVGVANLGNLGGLMRKLSREMDSLKLAGNLNARSVKHLVETKQKLNTKRLQEIFKVLKKPTP